MSTLFWQLNPAAPTTLRTPPLQGFIYKSFATNNSCLVHKQYNHISNDVGSMVPAGLPNTRIYSCKRFYWMHTTQYKDRAQAFPPTSALLLVEPAEDAALGVGERCRVTRAMVGGLQPWRTAAAEEIWEGRRMWEDAPLSISLSPGRKCLVRLPSSSTWLHQSAPCVLCWCRTPHERVVMRDVCRLYLPSQQKREKTPWVHPWRSRQTKHGAGCEQGRYDMQLCRTPLIGWPSSRARYHWANVVKVTGQTRNSLTQIVVK